MKTKDIYSSFLNLLSHKPHARSDLSKPVPHMGLGAGPTCVTFHQTSNCYCLENSTKETHLVWNHRKLRSKETFQVTSCWSFAPRLFPTPCPPPWTAQPNLNFLHRWPFMQLFHSAILLIKLLLIMLVGLLPAAILGLVFLIPSKVLITGFHLPLLSPATLGTSQSSCSHSYVFISTHGF